jgi:hypothetical protein
MTRLSPELATAIEQARSVSDPTPDNQERVRAALLARLGATEFHAPAPPATAPATVGASILFEARRHWVRVGGIVCAIGLGALVHASLSDSPSSPADVPSEVPSSKPVLKVDSRTPMWLEAPRRSIVEPPTLAAPVKVKAEPSASPGISEELPILLRAHAALDRHDGEAALAALNEHARRFPHGVLSEERAAERVVALCAAGHQAEGRAEREHFLKQHPHSTGVARVRGACP